MACLSPAAWERAEELLALVSRPLLDCSRNGLVKCKSEKRKVERVVTSNTNLSRLDAGGVLLGHRLGLSVRHLEVRFKGLEDRN